MNAVPKLRFSEDINAWTKGKATDLFDVLNGYAFKSRDSVNSGVPWVKIADVGVGKMKSASLSYLPNEFQKKYSKFLLTKGDFVLALTRPVLSNKLKIGKIGTVHHNGLLNQRVGKISSKEDAEFVNQILQRSSIVRMIEIQIAGTDPPNLAPSDFENIKVYYPSLPEQKKIADFLGAVDEKLRLLRARRESLTEYKKGVMQKIFTQTLRFKADDGSDFPDWEKQRLNTISEKHSSTLQAGNLTPTGNYPVFGADQISGYSDVYQSNIAYCSIVKDGAGVGRVAYRPQKSSVVGTCDRITAKGKNSIQYIFYYLSQFNFKPYVIGSTIPHIYFRDYGKFMLVVPHPDEQQKIADFLSTIDDKISAVANQITQMQDFKKGLLQQMFV